jgi:DNA invertase Pin-like site-specific DNA recombinase
MRTQRSRRTTMPKPSTAGLVAYVRVSTAGQAQSGLGLEAQRRAIRKASRAQGLTIAGWYEDAGRSGASVARRPGLRAALAEIQAERADGLICAKVDRLGRSAADVAGLVERAHKEGWRLIALDIGLDLGTPAGELVANALGMAARFEWRRISERQLEKHDELKTGRQSAWPPSGRSTGSRPDPKATSRGSQPAGNRRSAEREQGPDCPQRQTVGRCHRPKRASHP